MLIIHIQYGHYFFVNTTLNKFGLDSLLLIKSIFEVSRMRPSTGQSGELVSELPEFPHLGQELSHSGARHLS